MNTFQNGTFSVIHSNTTADFDNYTYSAVYFNASGTNFIINGTAVNGVAGELFPVIVDGSTTTLEADFLLLGNPKPAGINKTGKIIVTTYQWVDIKTGNILQQS